MMMLCFLGGVFGVLSAAGCGDNPTPAGPTTPNPKQLEKEGKSGGVMGGKSKG
jgi:hypothetical protein